MKSKELIHAYVVTNHMERVVCVCVTNHMEKVLYISWNNNAMYNVGTILEKRSRLPELQKERMQERA